MEDDLGANPKIAKMLSTKDYRNVFNQKLSRQGVLLLNTSLTVERGKPNSHKDIWKEFSSELILALLEKTSNVIWILWGSHAIKAVEAHTAGDSDLKEKHHFITSTHPSPFSANKPTKTQEAFFGSKPFSKCNNILSTLNKNEIKWI